MGKTGLLAFDLDGTLIDSKDGIVLSVNHALRSVGLRPFPEERVAGEIGQGPEHLFRQLIGPDAPIERIEELARRFRRNYGENFIQRTRVYPGILEMLDHYSDLPKVVVTNKSQQFADRLADALGLRPHFEAIFGWEAFPTRKPDRGPLVEICRRWNVIPDRAAMIGDSVFDVRAGRDAGLATVAVLYGLGSAEDLRGCRPDFEITDVDELATLFND